MRAYDQMNAYDSIVPGSPEKNDATGTHSRIYPKLGISAIATNIFRSMHAERQIVFFYRFHSGVWCRRTYRFLNASCSSCCLVRMTVLELRSAAAEGEFMRVG
jgi:hypothetical protein